MNYNTKDIVTQRFRHLRRYGIIAIPLVGTKARSAKDVKKPPRGLAWKGLREPLREGEFIFYLNKGYTGIGILTGRGLAVIDFDNPKHYKVFMAKFPQLRNTMINLSGGKHLPHVYIRYPEHLPLDTLHKDGVDLQADGAMVVTDPTQGPDFNCVRLQGDESSIVFVNENELNEIVGWIESLRPKKQREILKSTGEEGLLLPNNQEMAHPPINEAGLIRDFTALYYELRNDTGSRNVAYRDGLVEANTSDQREDFIRVVRPIFIKDRTNGHEPEDEREAEADGIEERTEGIRRSGKRKQAPVGFAEFICQRNFELGGQVLFGLWLANCGGQLMTANQISEALSPIIPIGNRSIYSGINLISRLSHLLSSYQPSPESPSSMVDIVELNALSTSNITYNRGSILAKSNIDEPDTLADDLSYIHTNDVSTPLTTYNRGSILAKSNGKLHQIPEKPEMVRLMPQWALASGKNFRLGTLLDLISEYPGMYSHAELAKRTKLSKSTIKRLLRELRTRGMIGSERVVKKTEVRVKSLPIIMPMLKNPQYGYWLQDTNEKMYPLAYEVVESFLLHSEKLYLVRRLPNRHWAIQDSNNS